DERPGSSGRQRGVGTGDRRAVRRPAEQGNERNLARERAQALGAAGIMTVSAHVAAFLSSLKTLAVWIIERLQQRPRRPHYTMRMAALNALVRAIWRQLASQIEYAF